MIDPHDGTWRRLPRARVRWESAGRADPSPVARADAADAAAPVPPGDVRPLEAVLLETARRDPDRVAMVGPDGARSYADLAAGALSVARFLAADAGIRIAQVHAAIGKSVVLYEPELARAMEFLQGKITNLFSKVGNSLQ